jgi:hypothetical protein
MGETGEAPMHVTTSQENQGTPVQTRLKAPLLSAIDDWRRQQSDLPNRPTAIRRLVERALSESEKSTQAQ